MINATFLSVKFTEVTLLHILILIGIPYILFYFFHRKTNFDNFPEKWELGLFVFVIGGTITLSSLLLIKIGLPFWFSYILFIFILSLILIILVLSLPQKNKGDDVGWIKIRLKNNELYTGVYGGYDKFGMHIISGKSDKIQKEFTSQKTNINAKRINFAWNEIRAILHY